MHLRSRVHRESTLSRTVARSTITVHTDHSDTAGGSNSMARSAYDEAAEPLLHPKHAKNLLGLREILLFMSALGGSMIVACSVRQVPVAQGTVTSPNPPDSASSVTNLESGLAALPSSGGKLLLIQNQIVTSTVEITKNNVDIECANGVSIAGSINSPLVLAVSVASLKIHNCIFANTFTTTGLRTPAVNNALVLTSCTKCTVANNTFTAGLAALRVLGGTGNVVTENTFTNISVVAISGGWDGLNAGSGLIVSNNMIMGTNDWPSWADYNGSPHDINLEDQTEFAVENNVIYDSGTLGLNLTETIPSAIQFGPNHVSTAQNFSVRNNTLYDDEMQARLVGIDFGSASTDRYINGSIMGNDIEGYAEGVYNTLLFPKSTQDIQISNNHISSFSQYGLILEASTSIQPTSTNDNDILVSGNEFSCPTNANPMPFAIYIKEVNGISVQNNSVTECK